MGVFTDEFDPAPEAPETDAAPPTIVKVSPGSFDASYPLARSEPIVVDITDTSGLAFFAVVRGQTVVYSGTGNSGGFGPDYAPSSITPIVDGFRLSLVPLLAWGAGSSAVTLVVSAVDAAGNLTSLTITLTLPVNTEDIGLGFRDNVWRWRRRLNRQKCSVVSVALDDRYAPNAGFSLTALAIEFGRKRGLDRVPWRAGSYTNSSGSGTQGNDR